MEKLFTTAQLAEIQQEADTNLDYYLDTRVIAGNANEVNILTISAQHQLIFTEGNDDTGFRHLRDRHARFSYQNYWQKAEQGYRLDDPSKFHPCMMPILDYVKIADALYAPENKNVTKNNYPDRFDKYTGSYVHQDEAAEKYHLLTYKDSRIVHTLFPHKKRHNRKTKLKLGKGTVKTSFTFPEGHNDLYLPYENQDSLPVYSILIRRYFPQEIEISFIQQHDATGAPATLYIINERKLDGFERFGPEDSAFFEYGDISEYEKVIADIDRHYQAEE
jgi:hypothetical protein